MTNLRFIQKLANSPWLADQEHVEFLNTIAMRYIDRAASGAPLDTRAIERELGRPLDNAHEVTIRDGAARIPVEGTIMRRASLFTQMSGGVSTETLMRDFAAAYDNPMVHSILFSFDTPGGEAHGINELAAAIRAKRDLGEKRIEAYCDGLCASAGYWLASATEWITADPTAALGSIGVVTSVRNPEAAGKRDTLEFWNARSPRKRPNPASYDGAAAIQEYVDDMGDEFIEAVADNRGVSTEKVEQDFGQGFVLTGRRAVEAGLADALGSEEEVMQRLQNRDANQRRPITLGTAGSPRTNTQGFDSLNTGTDVAGTPIRDHDRPPIPGGPVPVSADTSEAEGLMARFRSMLGLEPAPTATLEATREPATDRGEQGGNSVKLEDRDGKAVLVADSGEELELSAEDRNRLTSEATAELADLKLDNEKLRTERDHHAAEAESYRTAHEEARVEAAEQRVENELSGYEVSAYMVEAARPALLAAAKDPEDADRKAEADRWRTALSGSPKLERGERGIADGEAPSAWNEANERAKEIVASEKAEGRTISIAAARSRVWTSDSELAARARAETDQNGGE